MRFGNIELKHGLLLAPMAGYSDRAMRILAKKYGAEYSVTEMVSAKAVVYKDKKTDALARILNDEGNVAVQIFGNDPSVMAEAAAILESGAQGGVKPAAIDINMGCPVHKIFSNGEGSALMKSPELIERITRSVSSAISIPTTVKLRLGIDSESINVTECALAAEEGGASLITVHGRTKLQMYSGTVDLENIKKVKKSVHIPLIANGDITDAASALNAFSVTGADGIMIGRGAVGNPFIFAEIKAALLGESFTPPTMSERAECALFQLRVAVEEKGEELAVREARKQIALYMKGFSGAAALRAEVNRAQKYTEVESAFKAIIG